MKSISKPTAAALCLFAFPSLAQAEISATDVWTNLTAMTAAIGGDLSASLTETGDTLTVNDIVATFELPKDAGSFTFHAGTLSLIAQPDGSVELIQPKAQTITAVFQEDGAQKFSASAYVTLSDNVTRAVGDPGDITYDYSIASYRLDIGDIMAEDTKGPVPDISGHFAASDILASTRITQGALIGVSGRTTYGNYEFDYEVSQNGTPVINQTQRADDAAFTYDSAFPASGMSIMNMAAALRDGLTISAQTTSGKTTGHGSQIDPNMGQFDHRLSVATTAAEISFDTRGLRMDVTATDYDISAEMLDIMPFPITGSMADVAFKMLIPVLANDTPGDAVYSFTLDQLTMGDDLWNLFDPQSVLPRDPATVSLDLSAKLSILTDLLDVAAMSNLTSTPLLAQEVSLNALNVVLAGASLTGNGAVTLDNDDMDTFEGIPAPSGTFDFVLTGANDLMDSLVSMGLLPEDQAMGARMMLGLFARPGEGEDTLTSKIEIDGATGAISANGQRLQ